MRKNSSVAWVCVAASCIALCGCATLEQGSTQRLEVKTQPEVNASCVLSSPRGRWSVTTPGSVDVTRSEKDLDISCSRAGYKDGSLSVESKRVVCGSGGMAYSCGEPSVVELPSILVDNATGAFNRYPDTIEVPMEADR